MRVRHWLLLLAVLFLMASVAIPAAVRNMRQRQFSRVQQEVRSHGGQLSFDLVDGNYTLDLSGDSASDATIRSLVPTLKELPTGFTLLGPGESRLFWVTLSDSTVTDAGFTALCKLRLSWLTVNRGSISDASATQLSSANDLVGITLNDVELSAAAIKEVAPLAPLPGLGRRTQYG